MTHTGPEPRPRWLSWNVLVGVFLVVLATFSISTYFVESDARQDADAAQSECLADQFVKLSQALEIRGKATDKESAATRKIWDTYAKAAGLVKDDPTQELKPKDQARLQRELVKHLLAYQNAQTEIQEDREQNPIPPYPEGKCDQKG